MTATTLAMPLSRLDGPHALAGHDSDAVAVRTFWLVLVAALALIALAVKTWGLVALGLAALATVPVIFAVLLLITVGK